MGIETHDLSIMPHMHFELSSQLK